LIGAEKIWTDPVAPGAWVLGFPARALVASVVAMSEASSRRGRGASSRRRAALKGSIFALKRVRLGEG
jgi:hypothetical protein